MWAKDKVKLNENWDISLFSLSLHIYIYICLPPTHHHFIMKKFKRTEVERIKKENAETAGLPKDSRVTLLDIRGMLCFRLLAQLGAHRHPGNKKAYFDSYRWGQCHVPKKS